MQREHPSRPLYGVSGLTTPHNTILQDIEQVARTGGLGVGLFEAKLQEGHAQGVKDALAAHDLRATICIPRLWTILHTPLGPGEPDWRRRTELICQSLPKLATFNPVAIMVGPGVSGDPNHRIGPVEAVAEGLATIADHAADLGLRIGFEPLALRRGAAVATLPETVSLLDSVGRDNVDILFDIWHSWDEPDLHDRLRQHAHRFVAVQVSDYREPTRSWCDRVLPGEGRGVAPPILATLLEVGFSGWYDLEIFSDDGSGGFAADAVKGEAYPDSLWAIPHEELLARAKAAFDRSYATAQQLAAAR